MMRMTSLYLGMAVAGLLIPWLFLFDFFIDPHVGVPLFYHSLFSNPVSSAVSADLMISALVFFLFVYYEGSRLQMRRLWVYPLLTLGVGLSFGLPLFLYFRHRALETGND